MRCANWCCPRRCPTPISNTFDLREAGPWTLIRDAFACLFDPDDQIIRVIGYPVQSAGLLIEITMDSAPMRNAMLDYGGRILLLSALISGVTAFFLFLAVQRLIVLPIRRVVNHMTAYAEAPEDARRVIAPTASVVELRDAEEAMHAMQTQLTGSLRQKERLAQLGGAVAKISHDLRNILTTAQLFADRIEGSTDPMVVRVRAQTGRLYRARGGVVRINSGLWQGGGISAATARGRLGHAGRGCRRGRGACR